MSIAKRPKATTTAKNPAFKRRAPRATPWPPVLGDLVRDRVTGFTGVVVARTEWIFGCVRLLVQPRALGKDGAPKASSEFDEASLVVDGRLPGALRASAAGGPQPTPTQHKAPKR